MPKDAFPDRPVCTQSGIEIAKDNELVLSRHAVNFSSVLRIELFVVLIRILHGWGIDTYECGAVILGR